MFSHDSNFQRRLSISHKHGEFLAQIAPNNQKATYILMLCAFTAGFVSFCALFVRGFFRMLAPNHPPVTMTIVAVLLIPLFILVFWYVIGVRIALWRAFGVEQLTVIRGVLHWTRTALWWKHALEFPASDVSDVVAVTPWHSLSNRVEFTAQGQRHTIGDMLLRDEATMLALELRKALARA